MDELTLEKLYQVRKAKDKEPIRIHEKRTVDGSKIQQDKFYIKITISYRKDDVKCL